MTTPNKQAQLRFPPTILLADGRREVERALSEILDPVGYLTISLDPKMDPGEEGRASDPVEALEKNPAIQLVILRGDDEGATLLERIRAERGERVAALLLFEPGALDAEARCRELRADSYLVAPLKRDATIAICRDLLRIRELLAQIDGLESELETYRRSRQGSLSGSEAGEDRAPGSENHQMDAGSEGELEEQGRSEKRLIDDFEFFKRLLLMEVKRSKRYAYPISLALVALDDFRGLTDDWDSKDRGRAVGVALRRITQNVRDIDLAVLYAEEKVLVLMPHTPQQGALIVGERLRAAVCQSAIVLDGQERIRLTGSVGVSGFDGKGAVSFSELIRDATLAQRRAQDLGGDRVEAAQSQTRSRVLIG